MKVLPLPCKRLDPLRLLTYARKNQQTLLWLVLPDEICWTIFSITLQEHFVYSKNLRVRAWKLRTC